MVYITVMQSPKLHQMTLDELLSGVSDFSKYQVETTTNTRTYITKVVNEKLLGMIDVVGMIISLDEFSKQHESLFSVERKELYSTFHIPKRSGGLRRIDAPLPELMEALRQLKFILETNFSARYHTSAFAYIKGRSTIDSIKRHQRNESKWFVKLDFSDFFGSTSLDFVMKQLSLLFPFSEVIRNEYGKRSLAQALSLCFLDGKLPQGTPISPLLTNLIMIPLDHKISNEVRNFNKNAYVYTRYADDLLISSKYDFDPKEIFDFVVSVVKEFDAPYRLNPSKTRYGSSSGSNWNLGVMLNKNNEITIGHKKNRQFKAMINNFICDHVAGKPWEHYDVQVLSGLISYYKMVEKPYIEHVLNTYSDKYKVNVRKLIKERLR